MLDVAEKCPKCRQREEDLKHAIKIVRRALDKVWRETAPETWKQPWNRGTEYGKAPF